MHYCLHLLTKELPSKDKIAEIMKPYSEELFYDDCEEDENGDTIVKKSYPVFMWDWYRIGGRYKARLKLKCDLEDKENCNYYNWRYYEKNKRNGRLFLCTLLSELEEYVKPCWRYKEEDYFNYLGFYDGYIHVDGARQKDIVNLEKLDCYVCVLPDGSAIARENWNGKNWEEDKNFDEKYKQALLDNMDGFITVIDIHD